MSGERLVELPAPTASPAIAAIGVTLSLAGRVTHPAVSVVGAVMAVSGFVGWFRQVVPVERHEAVRVEAEDVVVVPARATVTHLAVGEGLHRASLPIAVYPYSAGVKGGIAGGAAMAVLAVVHGLLVYGSPWYTINILAATAMADLASADAATLQAFHPGAFAAAFAIHAIVSLVVGLLYGVLLPMAPRHPVLFGGVVAPLMWTGLLYATLRVINPLLDARIDWGAFVASQLAFGIVAGLVVSRSERIATMQHLPLLVRAGIETPFREREP
jgi:hypothetical protein